MPVNKPATSKKPPRPKRVWWKDLLWMLFWTNVWLFVWQLVYTIAGLWLGSSWAGAAAWLGICIIWEFALSGYRGSSFVVTVILRLFMVGYIMVVWVADEKYFQAVEHVGR